MEFNEYQMAALEELAQITATMPETRFQMALTMAITDLNRCRQLEAEAAAMRGALEKIAHPIPWLQKDAENKGYVLNGSAAVYLAKDANWLKDTAKQALAALEGGAE